jgi:hypothetical protein
MPKSVKRMKTRGAEYAQNDLQVVALGSTELSEQRIGTMTPHQSFCMNLSHAGGAHEKVPLVSLPFHLLGHGYVALRLAHSGRYAP